MSSTSLGEYESPLSFTTMTTVGLKSNENAAEFEIVFRPPSKALDEWMTIWLAFG